MALLEWGCARPATLREREAEIQSGFSQPVFGMETTPGEMKWELQEQPCTPNPFHPPLSQPGRLEMGFSRVCPHRILCWLPTSHSAEFHCSRDSLFVRKSKELRVTWSNWNCTTPELLPGESQKAWAAPCKSLPELVQKV